MRAARGRDPTHAGRRRRLRVPRRADARRVRRRSRPRQTLGFKPQWTTIGNNVTDTVAQFYTNAKDNYDGAYGIDIVFTDWHRGDRRVQSHRGRRRRRGVPAGTPTVTASPRVTCLQMQTLAQAIEAVDGAIDQASVIDALENLEDVPMIERAAGIAEPGQARRRRLRCSSPGTRRAPRQFEPIDDRGTDRGRIGERPGLSRSIGTRRIPNRRCRGDARAAVLEDEIRRAEASVVPETLLADAELPGVDDDAMSLREAMRIGGARTITIIATARGDRTDGQRRCSTSSRPTSRSRSASPTRCSARSAARPACCSSSARSRCRRCRTACRARTSSRSRCRSGRVIIAAHRARCRTRSRCSSPGSAPGSGSRRSSR